jgi:2'-phosphotransferase
LQDTLVIHGTNDESWQKIQNFGLCKMQRNHIHFTSGYPEDKPISGMRSSCSLFVELDVQLAIENGYEFYRSQNGVILSEGINGFIPKVYFKHVF